VIQFGNLDAPELLEHPEAIDIVNTFRLMQEVGGGLSIRELEEMEYDRYLALVVCTNAYLAFREIKEAEARARQQQGRGSSSSIMLNKEAFIGSALGGTPL